ncbi:hypothetical protein [Pseudoalteromonas phage J2-1_QLiu-2017]|nr:hypothetical protein [Pseudoalteromonas phage J2-1_QLiu-2017]
MSGKVGKPTVAQQAVNRHTEAAERMALEMGKMMPKAIAQLKKLVDNIENLKDNQQIAVIDRIFKYNKEFMEKYEETVQQIEKEQAAEAKEENTEESKEEGNKSEFSMNSFLDITPKEYSELN